MLGQSALLLLFLTNTRPVVQVTKTPESKPLLPASVSVVAVISTADHKPVEVAGSNPAPRSIYARMV